MFRNTTAICLHLVGPLRGKKSGASLTRCLHQTLTMAKRLQARRLDGIDHNPWVEFVQLASEEADVVNLGQGFPDFSPPEFAVEAFQHAVSGDFMLNQYTKAFGYPPLTKILASFFGKLLGQEIDPLKNVLVTVGAHGALFTAFQALVDEGDEVIIIEPFFDCYEPMTLMAGGRPVFVSLKPSPIQKGEPDSSSNWQLDPTELASKFTSRTKAFILNTPNNPLGKVPERPPPRAPLQIGLRACSVTRVLPWGLSFLIRQAGELTAESSEDRGSWDPRAWGRDPQGRCQHSRVGSYLTRSPPPLHPPPRPPQAAVAQSFEREQLHFGRPSSYFVQLPQYIQRCRDHMIQSLQSMGFRPVIPQGSYFLITDISDFKNKMPDLPGAADEPYDRRFVKWMIKNKGLVAVPVSIFFSLPHQKFFDHYIRFCFVKDESTLRTMDQKLQKWKAELTP
ncbi:PREDICTED: kynurenine--oxoglutarate transaminase 1 [Bison bison bison]|uniref:Kynurenine--oxoglutarate transaminase 1 n=1 Tax=Bison bison bison TaxID=43346 RepID=A0A6P3IT45_BISBB|nr:PREDICTED: kynurenine--oxoglutarate transaminase 1 [Bison bison bison]